jgi:hypothetical protein
VLKEAIISSVDFGFEKECLRPLLQHFNKKVPIKFVQKNLKTNFNVYVTNFYVHEHQ